MWVCATDRPSCEHVIKPVCSAGHQAQGCCDWSNDWCPSSPTPQTLRGLPAKRAPGTEVFLRTFCTVKCNMFPMKGRGWRSHASWKASWRRRAAALVSLSLWELGGSGMERALHPFIQGLFPLDSKRIGQYGKNPNDAHHMKGAVLR